MSKSCPISLKKVNSNLIRIYSIQVALIAVTLIFTKLPVFAFILLFDFSVRALRLPRFSPIHMIAKFIIHTLKIKPMMSDEAPKRFALYMGLFMSLTLSLLYSSSYYGLATLTAIVLLTCALLEGLFNYCVGCRIYQVIKTFK